MGSQTDRHGLCKNRSIDFIHRTKVLHAGQEDIALDDVIEIGPRSFEDRTEIGKDLSLRRCVRYARGRKKKSVNTRCVLGWSLQPGRPYLVGSQLDPNRTRSAPLQSPGIGKAAVPGHLMI